MDYIKGIVKKYLREYVRTLKNGEKKKYKTEQVQITIPKQNDIFNDKEEVIIISSKYKKEVENSFDIINSLEFHNYLIKKSNKELKSMIEKNKSVIGTHEEEIATLNKQSNNNADIGENTLNKIIKQKNTIQNGTICFDSPEKRNLSPNSHDFTMSSQPNNYFDTIKLNKLKEDKKLLKKEITNLQAVIKEMEENENRKFLDLQNQYKELNMNYINIQEELHNTKRNKLYYENIAKKLKEFIVHSY